jgi:hypothetical protein
MGSTIPSFRIATVWEEEKGKLYRKYLRNKNEKRLFTNMFSIVTLYNSACFYAVIPIRIFPIFMSIVFNYYKILTEKNFFFHSSSGFDFSLPSSDGGDEDINDYDKNNKATTILKQELDKRNNFSFVLRKQNRELFEKMLQSSYKYSDAINAIGKEFSTESLLISLIFDQLKTLLINAVSNITNNNNKNSVKE